MSCPAGPGHHADVKLVQGGPYPCPCPLRSTEYGVLCGDLSEKKRHSVDKYRLSRVRSMQSILRIYTETSVSVYSIATSRYTGSGRSTVPEEVYPPFHYAENLRMYAYCNVL